MTKKQTEAQLGREIDKLEALDDTYEEMSEKLGDLVTGLRELPTKADLARLGLDSAETIEAVAALRKAHRAISRLESRCDSKMERNDDKVQVLREELRELENAGLPRCSACDRPLPRGAKPQRKLRRVKDGIHGLDGPRK